MDPLVLLLMMPALLLRRGFNGVLKRLMRNEIPLNNLDGVNTTGLLFTINNHALFYRQHKTKSRLPLYAQSSIAYCFPA
jgi:hypothetical protein